MMMVNTVVNGTQQLVNGMIYHVEEKWDTYVNKEVSAPRNHNYGPAPLIHPPIFSCTK